MGNPTPEGVKEFAFDKTEEVSRVGSVIVIDHGYRKVKGYPVTETEIAAIEAYHAQITTWSSYAATATGATIGFVWDICTSSSWNVPSIVLGVASLAATIALLRRVEQEKKSKKSYFDLVQKGTTFRP